MAGRQYGRMKNRFLIFILTLVILMASGCRKESAAPMRIGTNTWPGYEPMYLAAFGKKEIEAAALTLDEVMSLTQFEKGISIILVADISDGADVIIGHEEINNLEGLKGRRIGAETTAVGIYMLHRALEKAGLAEKEVKVVNLNEDEHETAFLSGKVDAVVTFEPVRTISKALAIGESDVVGMLKDYHWNASLSQALLLSLEQEAGWAIRSKLTEKTEAPNYLDLIYPDVLLALKPEAVRLIR